MPLAKEFRHFVDKNTRDKQDIVTFIYPHSHENCRTMLNNLLLFSREEEVFVYVNSLSVDKMTVYVRNKDCSDYSLLILTMRMVDNAYYGQRLTITATHDEKYHFPDFAKDVLALLEYYSRSQYQCKRLGKDHISKPPVWF